LENPMINNMNLIVWAVVSPRQDCERQIVRACHLTSIDISQVRRDSLPIKVCAR
jgi:hypothetical protein